MSLESDRRYESGGVDRFCQTGDLKGWQRVGVEVGSKAKYSRLRENG